MRRRAMSESTGLAGLGIDFFPMYPSPAPLAIEQSPLQISDTAESTNPEPQTLAKTLDSDSTEGHVSLFPVVSMRSHRGMQGLLDAELGGSMVELDHCGSGSGFRAGQKIVGNASPQVNPIKKRERSATLGGPPSVTRRPTLLSHHATPQRNSAELKSLLGTSGGKLAPRTVIPPFIENGLSQQQSRQASFMDRRKSASTSDLHNISRDADADCSPPAQAISLEKAKPKARVEVDLLLESETVVQGGYLRGKMEVCIRKAGKNEDAVWIGDGKVRVVGFESISNDETKHTFYQIAQPLPEISASCHLLYNSTPDDEGYHKAKEGTHLISFSMLIPVGGAGGAPKGVWPNRCGVAVQYIVIGSIKLKYPQTSDRSISHFYRHVEVYPNLDPTVALAPLERPLQSTTSQSLFLGGTGKVRLQAILHRRIWIAGQRCYVRICLDNQSNKKIKTLTLSLVRTITAFKPKSQLDAVVADGDGNGGSCSAGDYDACQTSTTRKLLVESVLESGQKGEKGHVTAKGWWTGVEAAQSMEVSHYIPVPPDALSIARGRLLEIDYAIKVSASAGALSSDICVTLPIRIISLLSIDPPPSTGIAAPSSELERSPFGWVPLPPCSRSNNDQALSGSLTVQQPKPSGEDLEVQSRSTSMGISDDQRILDTTTLRKQSQPIVQSVEREVITHPDSITTADPLGCGRGQQMAKAMFNAQQQPSRSLPRSKSVAFVDQSTVIPRVRRYAAPLAGNTSAPDTSSQDVHTFAPSASLPNRGPRSHSMDLQNAQQTDILKYAIQRPPSLSLSRFLPAPHPALQQKRKSSTSGSSDVLSTPPEMGLTASAAADDELSPISGCADGELPHGIDVADVIGRFMLANLGHLESEEFLSPEASHLQDENGTSTPSISSGEGGTSPDTDWLSSADVTSMLHNKSTSKGRGSWLPTQDGEEPSSNLANQSLMVHEPDKSGLNMLDSCEEWLLDTTLAHLHVNDDPAGALFPPFSPPIPARVPNPVKANYISKPRTTSRRPTTSVAERQPRYKALSPGQPGLVESQYAVQPQIQPLRPLMTNSTIQRRHHILGHARGQSKSKGAKSQMSSSTSVKKILSSADLIAQHHWPIEQPVLNTDAVKTRKVLVKPKTPTTFPFPSTTQPLSTTRFGHEAQRKSLDIVTPRKRISRSATFDLADSHPTPHLRKPLDSPLTKLEASESISQESDSEAGAQPPARPLPTPPARSNLPKSLSGRNSAVQTSARQTRRRPQSILNRIPMTSTSSKSSNTNSLSPAYSTTPPSGSGYETNGHVLPSVRSKIAQLESRSRAPNASPSSTISREAR